MSKPRNSKSRGNRNQKPGYSAKKSAETRNDQLVTKGNLKVEGRPNNPNWYFVDATQADVMSRIQMNAFAALSELLPTSTTTSERMNPAVVAYYVNPCPGVTFSNPTDATMYPANESKIKGINRAAQKLWYMLSATSGRSAAYSKTEISKLMLAISAMISTYEFIRRVFGISYGYSQRNRSLPTLLWEAMNVDPDDYRQNAADYLKRMNSLMAVMNTIPIFGNCAYFAKSQDLFQKIFMDAPSEMAQLFMFCPSTTWVLEENDGFIGGSYLRTVDMCQFHEDTAGVHVGKLNGSNVSQRRNKPVPASGYRPLADYIDIFEEQINALAFSSNYAVVYADILRAFDSGALSRWAFDYIDEKYLVVPEYSEAALWQLHNATILHGWCTLPRSTFQSAFDGTNYWSTFNGGTPQNDVYDWASDDVLVYNPPVFTAFTSNTAGCNESDWKLIDFPNEAPSVEDRIENTRYSIINAMGGLDGTSTPKDVLGSTDGAYVHYNFALPDYWIEMCRLFFKEDDAYSYAVADSLYKGDYSPYSLVTTNALSRYHLAPTIYTNVYSSGVNVATDVNAIFGELNAWTKIKFSWFNAINDMIYVDLFDIR